MLIENVVDSAQAYRNEESMFPSVKVSLTVAPVVGRVVAASSIPRSSIFLTTKYMPSHHVSSSLSVMKQLHTSVRKIDQVSQANRAYIDLMLIHAPWGGPKGRASNWKALADAQAEGWIKDIGVSNLSVVILIISFLKCHFQRKFL